MDGTGVERGGVGWRGWEGRGVRGLLDPLHGSPVSGVRALIKLQTSRICLHFQCDNPDLLMHIISRHQPTKHLETFGKDSGAQKEAAASKCQLRDS